MFLLCFTKPPNVSLKLFHTTNCYNTRKTLLGVALNRCLDHRSGRGTPQSECARQVIDAIKIGAAFGRFKSAFLLLHYWSTCALYRATDRCGTEKIH